MVNWAGKSYKVKLNALLALSTCLLTHTIQHLTLTHTRQINEEIHYMSVKPTDHATNKKLVATQLSTHCRRWAQVT